MSSRRAGNYDGIENLPERRELFAAILDSDEREPVTVRLLVNCLAIKDSQMARRLGRVAFIVSSMALPGCFELLALQQRLKDECQADADCDDGVWCNGEEVCNILCSPETFCPGNFCDAGRPACCRDGGDPGCAIVNPELCNEETRQCEEGNECASDADCSDDIFCNGEEYCIHGLCLEGNLPCRPFPDAPDLVCNEVEGRCEGYPSRP